MIIIMGIGDNKIFCRREWRILYIYGTDAYRKTKGLTP